MDSPELTHDMDELIRKHGLIAVLRAFMSADDRVWTKVGPAGANLKYAWSVQRRQIVKDRYGPF